MGRLLDILPVAGIVLGLCIVAYYPASEVVDAYRRLKVAESVEVAVAEADTSTLDEIFAQARAYNAYLAGGSDAEIAREEVWPYEEQLALPAGHDTSFGYLIIPTISLTMPIYRGTSDAVLSAGAGHLEGTSLPVGGASTHAVITGHTGMSGMRAFDDIRELESGDVIGVRVLGELVCYEVYGTETVLPEEVEERVAIEAGEDLLTLVTCTPYGINTHRLLVHARRCAVPEGFEGSVAEMAEAVADAAGGLVAPAAALTAAVVVATGAAVRWRRRRRGRMRSGEPRAGRRPTRRACGAAPEVTKTRRGGPGAMGPGDARAEEHAGAAGGKER